MNKKELIKVVSAKTGLPPNETFRAVDHILAQIAQSLARGESFQLVGFGSFSISEKSERQGKNPQTGEVISIPAVKNVKFKAGKGLKEAVNS